METSLHRALKRLYAAHEDAVEVVVGRYRIDAIDDSGRLVEIQHAGLGSIRSKIKELVKDHAVRVIKPLIQCKILEKLDPRTHRVLSRRKSPKKASHLDVFAELIHFTNVFPHQSLTIEIPLLEVVESRVPKKNARWKRKQYKIIEQKVIEVGETFILSTHDDLWRLLGNPDFSESFGSAEIATWLDRPRWFGQQVAYVLQKCGATQHVGKQGNNKLYRRAA